MKEVTKLKQIKCWEMVEMNNDARTREERALNGVKSYMFVSDGHGGVKVVERDTFYDLAGEDLENAPKKPAFWYLKDEAVPNDGVVKRRAIDEFTAAEREAFENQAQHTRAITGVARRVCDLVAEPAYK